MGYLALKVRFLFEDQSKKQFLNNLRNINLQDEWYLFMNQLDSSIQFSFLVLQVNIFENFLKSGGLIIYQYIK